MKKLLAKFSLKVWLAIILGSIVLITIVVSSTNTQESSSYQPITNTLEFQKDWPKSNWPSYVETKTPEGELWSGKLYDGCMNDLALDDYSTPLSQKTVLCYTKTELDIYKGLSLTSSETLVNQQSAVEKLHCDGGYCSTYSDQDMNRLNRKIWVSKNNYLYIDYNNFILNGKNILPLPDLSDAAHSSDLAFIVWKDSQCNIHTFVNGTINSALQPDCSLEFTDADINKNGDTLYVADNSDDPNVTVNQIYEHVYLNNKQIQVPSPFNDSQKFQLNSFLFQENSYYATSTAPGAAFCFDAETLNKDYLPNYNNKYTVCDGKVVNYTGNETTNY
jgi:hypothetical protein